MENRERYLAAAAATPPAAIWILEDFDGGATREGKLVGVAGVVREECGLLLDCVKRLSREGE